MGGELYAFVEGYDYAFLLRHDLAKTLGVWLPLVMIMDSVSLFYLLNHTFAVSSEKRLMIDIVALRASYGHNNITGTRWIQSGHNVADAITKPGLCASLEACLESCLLCLNVAQSVVRSPFMPAESSAQAVDTQQYHVYNNGEPRASYTSAVRPSNLLSPPAVRRTRPTASFSPSCSQTAPIAPSY